MKTSLKIIPAASVLLISFVILMTACKKNSSPSTVSGNSDGAASNLSVNGATSDNALDDAFSIAVQTGNDKGLVNLMQQKNSGQSTLGFGISGAFYCANVSVSGSSFPITVTVDFGSGCVSADSVNRSGSITYVFSGKLSNPGTTISATFNNYVVNGYKLGGNYAIKNTTTLSGFSLTTTATSDTVTYPNDTTYYFSGSKTVTLASGSISNLASLVFNITGGYSISDSYGESLTATVTTPLVRKETCKNIVQGVTSFKYSTSSVSLNGNINYGDGTCDNTALITIGSFTKTVTLP